MNLKDTVRQHLQLILYYKIITKEVKEVAKRVLSLVPVEREKNE
jgi:hypothetical protein